MDKKTSSDVRATYFSAQVDGDGNRSLGYLV